MSPRRLPRALGPIRFGSGSDRASLVALGAAALLALVIASPSVGGRAPGDPAAFAGDARFARCGGGTVPTRYAFEVERARDYRAHLPAMSEAAELELDQAALVVVFEGVGPFVSVPTAPPGGTPRPVRTALPGRHDVCIYVGEAGAGQLSYFRDVPIAGLRVEPRGDVLESPDLDGTS